jgi:Icc protein
MHLEPRPSHVIVHITDTHLLDGGAPLHGTVDTIGHLHRAMERVEESGLTIDAIIHTGDIADLGELDAYRRARAILEPAAARLGCPIVWVAGNHDQRGPLRAGIFGSEPTTEPVTTVVDVSGLRIIGIDTSVPGEGHGHLDEDQLAWLSAELARPAPAGTILALHHPPVATQVRLLESFQLDNPDDLAASIAGSDVRALIAGHFHYGVSGTLDGRPVSVATATSYTVRVDSASRGFNGFDAEQAINFIFVYDSTIAHVAAPLGVSPAVVSLPDGFFDSPDGLVDS